MQATNNRWPNAERKGIMFPMILTSAQNPKIKHVIALRERRERDRSGLMRVEGYEEVSLAFASGVAPRSLFLCPALFRTPEQWELVDRLRAAGADVFEVSEEIFRKIAYREGPDGWLATFAVPDFSLAALRVGANPFVAVAESVEKPGNLGAILRTADAAGVDALISAAPTTDWGNPNIVRSSKGALFSVPVAEAANDETISWLRERGIAIVVTTPQASMLYTEADLLGPVAIVVGTEKYGVSSAWLEQATLSVRIPMYGRVNSLNVATATALLIYEVVRQRSQHEQHGARTGS